MSRLFLIAIALTSLGGVTNPVQAGSGYQAIHDEGSGSGITRGTEKYFNLLKYYHTSLCIHLYGGIDKVTTMRFMMNSEKELGITAQEIEDVVKLPSYPADIAQLFESQGGVEGCQGPIRFFHEGTGGRFR